MPAQKRGLLTAKSYCTSKKVKKLHSGTESSIFAEGLEVQLQLRSAFDSELGTEQDPINSNTYALHDVVVVYRPRYDSPYY